MKHGWNVLIVGSLFTLSGVVFASGGPPSGLRLPDAEYDNAVAEIKLGHYEVAISSLEAVIDRRPDDADAHNWLGYSLRKLKRYDVAEKHYLEALKLDPKHIGAHEYLGELYVETKRLDLAKQQLSALEKLCPNGCEEREDLERAIEKGTASYQ